MFDERATLRIAVKILLLISLSAYAVAARAQSPITAITLSPEQIGQVKTAQGISTRISFPEKIKEVICGDLYDANSGNGSFVIQYSDNDVFLKPIVSKGMSNMFVKTGEGDLVYNFDLEIVPVAQAHRVVNVTLAARARSVTSNHTEDNGAVMNPADLEQRKNEIEKEARREADEILRNARQQADRITKQAQAKIAEEDTRSAQQRQKETERRFMQGVMLGVREAKVKNTRAAADKAIIAVDPKIFIFDDKAYLRYTVQNGGTDIFTFASVSLETVTAEGGQPIPFEMIQSKAENSLEPGESLTGVLVFDPKSLSSKDKIMLYVRGQENAEIARVNIQ